MKRFSRNGKLLLGVAAVLVGLGCLGALAGLRFNLTRSLPVGIYRIATESPRQGSIVVVCLPLGTAEFARERGYLGPGFCPGGVRGLGKIVLATAGDVVTHHPEALLVNQRSIPNSATLARDSRRRPLPHFPWGDHVLKACQLWLFSPYHQNSYDSRYFGPVQVSQMISVLKPVWTWHSSVDLGERYRRGPRPAPLTAPEREAGPCT